MRIHALTNVTPPVILIRSALGTVHVRRDNVEPEAVGHEAEGRPAADAGAADEQQVSEGPAEHALDLVEVLEHFVEHEERQVSHLAVVELEALLEQIRVPTLELTSIIQNQLDKIAAIIQISTSTQLFLGRIFQSVFSAILRAQHNYSGGMSGILFFKMLASCNIARIFVELES